MPKTYLVTGWSSRYVDPGFEFQCKTLKEAKAKAEEVLEGHGQTTVRIYEAREILKAHRSNRDTVPPKLEASKRS